MEKTFQSAAKPYQDNDMEGSETIPKGSTQLDSLSIDENNCGSATPQTDNAVGDEIVRNEYFIKFIEKANKKFNNKFDYSKFIYTKAKDKSIVICPIHGEFLTNVGHHLDSVYGCPKCANENEQRWKKYSEQKKGVSIPEKYLTKEEVLKRLNNKFGDIFIYDLNSNEWSGNTTIIKIYCKKHGWFEKDVHNLLMSGNTYGCNKCALENRNLHKTHDKEQVFKELEQIWNNKYIYTDEAKNIYKNKSTKIPIICPEHGVFYKNYFKHKYQECPKCVKIKVKENNLLPGGYCERLFIEKPELKDIPAHLYYFKINDGEYYKIGITITNVKKRITGLISSSKKLGINLKIENICEKQMSLYKAFQLEQMILNKYSKYRNVTQKWSTEIFNIDIYDFIKDIFIEHIPTNIKQETL